MTLQSGPTECALVGRNPARASLRGGPSEWLYGCDPSQWLRGVHPPGRPLQSVMVPRDPEGWHSSEWPFGMTFRAGPAGCDHSGWPCEVRPFECGPSARPFWMPLRGVALRSGHAGVTLWGVTLCA